MNEKRPLTFSLFLLRLLSGFVGGITGTLSAFVIYFVMISFVPAGDEATSISVFIVIIMAFVATLTANTLTATMVTFLDNEKYSRRKTIITHVFIFNLVLFFLTIPFYLLGISLDIVIGVAALHFVLSAFVSSLIMEIIAGHEYSLVGVYGSSLAIFITIALAFVALITNPSDLLVTFLAMPITWVVLQLIGGLTELVYDNFLKIYGMDALNAGTDLGGDFEIEEKEEDDQNDL